MPNPIIAILDLILGVYFWIVFFYFFIQLLAYFNVINTNEPIVIKITKILGDMTEPVLKKIRRYVRPRNGFDFAPIILILTLKFLQYCLMYYFA